MEGTAAWGKVLVHNPSDKHFRAKYCRDSPNLRGSSGASPQMLEVACVRLRAGQKRIEKGMNKSLSEAQCLDRLNKNRQ